MRKRVVEVWKDELEVQEVDEGEVTVVQETHVALMGNMMVVSL